MKLTFQEVLSKRARMQLSTNVNVNQRTGHSHEEETGILWANTGVPDGPGDIDGIQVIGNSILPVIRTASDSIAYAELSFSEALAGMKVGMVASRYSDQVWMYMFEPSVVEGTPDRFVRYMRGGGRGSKALIEAFTVQQLLADDWLVESAGPSIPSKGVHIK